MIGNAKVSTELAGIAFVLWGGAYGWYFWLGAGRLSAAFRQLMIHLRLRSPDQPRPPRPAAKQP